MGEITREGRIFEAWEDEPWIVEGAAVRVSIVCFDAGGSSGKRLDGEEVAVIHPNLTAGITDITIRRALSENKNTCFVGVILNGQFEVTGEIARNFLKSPLNVNGRPNSDVIRPTLNGDDFNGDRPDKWIIDFGTSLSEKEASLYEKPFRFVETHVRPFRQRKKPDGEFAVRANNERSIWWRHARARPAMRKALFGLTKYIATPMVSSFRTFGFLHPSILPDQKLVVFARSDHTFLGMLHCHFHYVWTLATCSWIGSGNDVTYSNTSVFETFPFAEGLEPVRKVHA